MGSHTVPLPNTKYPNRSGIANGGCLIFLACILEKMAKDAVEEMLALGHKAGDNAVERAVHVRQRQSLPIAHAACELRGRCWDSGATVRDLRSHCDGKGRIRSLPPVPRCQGKAGGSSLLSAGSPA